MTDNGLISPQHIRLAALIWAAPLNRSPWTQRARSDAADRFMKALDAITHGKIKVCPHCGSTDDAGYAAFCYACERRICISCEPFHAVLSGDREPYCDDCADECPMCGADGRDCGACSDSPGLLLTHYGRVELARKEAANFQDSADTLREATEWWGSR